MNSKQNHTTDNKKQQELHSDKTKNENSLQIPVLPLIYGKNKDDSHYGYKSLTIIYDYFSVLNNI